MVTGGILSSSNFYFYLKNWEIELLEKRSYIEGVFIYPDYIDTERKDWALVINVVDDEKTTEIRTNRSNYQVRLNLRIADFNQWFVNLSKCGQDNMTDWRFCVATASYKNDISNSCSVYSGLIVDLLRETTKGMT